MQSCLEFGFVPAPGGAPLPGEQVNRVKTRNHGRLLPVWLPLYQERAIRGRGTRYGKIRSVAGTPVRPVVFERQLVGVRDGSWKYIMDDGGEELYALKSDPLETHNLASRETEVAARLKAEIEQRLAAHPLDLPNPSMVNQRLRATLRTLGYTD